MEVAEVDNFAEDLSPSPARKGEKESKMTTTHRSRRRAAPVAVE